MSSSMPLRRSSRIKQTARFEEDIISYPDGPPSTPVEKWVSKLDQEAFPSDDYARIDDIVVYCLFASKRTPRFYRALRPTRAFLENELPIPIDTALDICKTYLRLAVTSNDSLSVASSVASTLTQNYPSIFCGKRDEKILKHLLQRYHIMTYSSPKPICVEKVQFHLEPGSGVTCGLKALVDIDACVVILASCSSMSSNVVLGRPGVSVITSSPRQKGETGPRLILGPFRFANHDCSPNCQIMPIPNSYAYALCTLRKIQAGQSITVNYARDGSYFGEKPCGCATCNPDLPPIAKKRPFDESLFLPNPNGKRSRRGGKRAKRRRPRVPAVVSESPEMIDAGASISLDYGAQAA